MTDATSEFFDRLGKLGHVSALERTSGTLRFDLEGSGGRTRRRSVAIKRGAVVVSDTGDEDRADCVVRMPATLFDDLASGRANAMAAMLRGAGAVEGDRTLLIRFQRLFPPAVARTSGPADRSTGRRRG
jgi:putative sterol carrier protein